MVSPHHSRGDDDRLPEEVLAHSRRRHTLRILSEAGSSMALADVAAEIASHEQPTPADEPDWELIKRIYISLYHWHVPKLDDHKLVEFSMARRTVTLADSLSPTLRTKLAA